MWRHFLFPPPSCLFLPCRVDSPTPWSSVPTDPSVQPRSAAVSRQYYTLPNNGGGVDRRTSAAAPLNAGVDSPRFHPHAKGKNIRLDGQLRRATRKNSFCNGITFSHRPVHLYEKVGCYSSADFLFHFNLARLPVAFGPGYMVQSRGLPLSFYGLGVVGGGSCKALKCTYYLNGGANWTPVRNSIAFRPIEYL